MTNELPKKEEASPVSVAPKDDVQKKDSNLATAIGKKNDKKRGNRRGRKERQPKEFEEVIIGIDRVTRVTAGGRQMRFRVSVVIGDRKGRVGFGMGKASEVMGAVQKAVTSAKNNLFRVPIYKDSIPHEVVTKFKATKIILLPAPEGKGVIAGGAVRQILDLAGIQNVMSKLHGSRNKINVSFATIKALRMLQNRAPKEKVADEKPSAEKEEKVKK